MRNKVILLVSILVIVIMYLVLSSLMNGGEYSSGTIFYRDVLHLDEKYWEAYNACRLYLEENDFEYDEYEVTVEEVIYGNEKEDLQLLEGTYEDEEVLWKFVFLMDDCTNYAIFYDSEAHKVIATSKDFY